MNEILHAGLEVALPERDRGIDLIAYSDLDSEFAGFVAIPIQMKVATKRAFSIDHRYSKFPMLILAYTWNVDGGDQETYALTYQDAYKIAEKMGWTKTVSWERGAYSTPSPSKKLLDLLEPHRTSDAKWRELVVGSGSA